LKEELSALIAYVNKNKAEDNDWFKIAPQDKTGTQWKGTCWFVHEHVKYEFNLQFEVPVTYPETAPEIEIPSLDGKTAKIYRLAMLALISFMAIQCIICAAGEAKSALASTSSRSGAKMFHDSVSHIVRNTIHDHDALS
jgi:hypothetical protein